MEIHEKWYKRWTSIYMEKGTKDGWAEAKAWAGRTLPPAVITKLRPHIERAMGVRK